MNAAPATTQVSLEIYNNIAEISFFNPGLAVNSIDRQMMHEMEFLLDQLQEQRGIEGLILYSKKAGSFLAGADLTMLDLIDQASEAEQISQQGQALIQRLEDLPYPVVAAINGACFGGGLEMSLACSARICSDAVTTRFGLPEILMGLIPGAGGCQRLPALIGLESALDLILQSRELRPEQALKLGLIDDVVVAEHLLHAARDKIRTLSCSKNKKTNISQRLKFWQRLPLGKALSENSVSHNLILAQARDRVQQQSHGHYPAPFALLRVVETGLEHGIPAGYSAEAEAWGQLVVSKESRQLRHIYLLGRSAFHLAPENKTLAPIHRVALLGCGRVGSSIALRASSKGQNLRIVERDRERMQRSLRELHSAVDLAHQQDSLPIEAQRQINRISLCTDFSGLAGRDIIIEAVADKMQDKQHALSQLEGHNEKQSILASSSAYLPLAMLSKKLSEPQNLIGLHFLRPMQTNQLVELVVCKNSAAQTVAKTQAWLHSLGKRSVVVKDGPGYYTTRSLMAYLLESLRILEEGAAVADIDQAMRAFGMHQGPFRLLDRLGLDLTLRIAELLQEQIPARFSVVNSLRALRNDGRFGVKNKRGFYRYEGPTQGQVDPSIYDLLTGGQRRKSMEAKQVQERLLLAWINAAQDCLDAGILRSADDGDLLAVSGLGFPGYLGGPFNYLRQHGVERVRDKLLRLEKQQGARFAPAAGIEI